MNLFYQITPAYPPSISGVGDYSALLVNSFREAGYEISTVVTSTEGNLKSSEEVIPLDKPEASALAQLLASSKGVLLHFSGYGYAHRGLCRWLVDGLQLWKQSRQERQLITIFHEVYATGPIWRASFWTAGSQRRIARDLARLSDSAFVTSQAGYERLHVLHPALPLQILPVFSNVGEPQVVAPIAERDSFAVVFGGSGKRTRVYKALAQQTSPTEAGFKRLHISEVIDIGPGACAPQSLAGLPVRKLGSLPPQEVSTWLSRARIGLIDYPLHVITKSGIAAAYFAHALLVVNTSRIGCLPDGLIEGREFISLKQFREGFFEPQLVTTNGWTWYQPHNLKATAHIITATFL